MRGESGRVAVRVRSLLSEHGRPAGRSTDTFATGGGGARFGDEALGDEVLDGTALDGEAPRDEVLFGGGAVAAGRWHRFAAQVAARVPVRVDPGRRAALAVAGAVALAAVLTGAWLVAERPRALAVSSTASPIAGASSPVGRGARPAPIASPVAPTSSPVEVVVDVAGRVRHPGVYRLPPGSRVENAVSAAGGPLAGVKLDSLNLAAKVVDGQQISVGVAPAAGGGGAVAGGGSGGDAGGSGGGAGADGPTAPVDLNSATLEQLETLPGVGPVLGQHILDWRAAHGRFATVDQLNDVPGIGEVKFAGLRDLVAVG